MWHLAQNAVHSALAGITAAPPASRPVVTSARGRWTSQTPACTTGKLDLSSTRLQTCFSCAARSLMMHEDLNSALPFGSECFDHNALSEGVLLRPVLITRASVS